MKTSLSRRDTIPGITADGWFINTDEGGSSVYGFGSSGGLQEGIITIGCQFDGGTQGAISYATLLTFDTPQPADKIQEEEPEGKKTTDIVAKLASSDDTEMSAFALNKLQPGGFVPKVYKALIDPQADDDPQVDSGLSILVMERLEADAHDMMHKFFEALKTHGTQYRLFNRLKMMQKLVAGLWYAHQKGIAHEDVKLKNLMNAGGDKWKIIDWDGASTDDPESFPTDVLYAGACLLFAGVPELLLNKEAWEAVSRDFLEQESPHSSLKVFTILRRKYGLYASKDDPDDKKLFFLLLAETLCGPADRTTMKEFSFSLSEIAKGDLPLFKLQMARPLHDDVNQEEIYTCEIPPDMYLGILGSDDT